MSTSHDPHPSFLALDRLSLGTPSPQVEEHVASCEQCRQHVRALSEAPAPSSLLAIHAGIERRRRRLGLLATGSSILAAAACLLLVLGREQAAPSETAPVYVGAKGFASVWIYVKRGNTTQLWDGKQQVFAGDRLRIKLDPSGFRQVAVYSLKDADAPELLYSGSVVPAHSSTLPDAWEVDGQPGAERLVVVLSNDAIKPSWSRWLNGEVEGGIAVLSFVLPKSSSPPPDASVGGP